MKKGRIFSGMRPTGKLHLGHLIGALNNWVKLQDEYDCIYGVANWHALTDRLETKDFSDDMYDMVRDWLAAGIDPSKSIIFVQSDVVEHAELYLLLGMLTPVPWLERCTTFKEKIKDMRIGKPDISYGLLGYPVLQTADIIIYKANAVPVGEDQLPHVELSREIARRFNYYFGEIFPEPKALLTETARLMGLDGKTKMSKSLGNFISLSDTPDEIKAKVQTMFTDPKRLRLNDPGHPDSCNVFSYYKIFGPADIHKELHVSCKESKIGCTECKKNLSKYIEGFVVPFQEKQKKWNRDQIKVILEEGAKKARMIAQSTMEEVRKAMKIGI